MKPGVCVLSRPTMAGLTALLLALPARAQAPAPLTLAQALNQAERSAFANRIAAGESESRAGEALAPLRGILPSLRLESGYVRTTDPLNAFGFTLRQRAVTPAAFAPDRLNDPTAVGNFTTGLVLEQPLFNADAWAGRRAARAARDAAGAAERWSRASTAVAVIQSYWGAVLAAERVLTLNTGHQAALAHARQAEALVARGMATRSDALLASVKAGEVESELLRARTEARLARLQLALIIGAPGDTVFDLPDSLPGADVARLLAGSTVLAEARVRADVVAAQRGLEAARASLRRSRSLYLPRINGFGRLDWNSPDTPLEGRSAWTVGVMLSWSPFAGASEIAELRSARGRARSAAASVEASVAQANLETIRAADQLTLALARLEIAERARAQATEAHRIVARKYDGGLSSVTDLFDAAAAETVAQLGFSAARYEVMSALADKQRAAGLDPEPLGDQGEPLNGQ